MVFPHLLARFEEDLVDDGILILYGKIGDYDLEYCDKQGKAKPVRFSSYIRKRIDGFIIDYLNADLRRRVFMRR